MKKNQISIIFLALTFFTAKLGAIEEIEKYKKEIQTSYSSPAWSVRGDPLNKFPIVEHHKSKSSLVILSFLDRKDYQRAFTLPDVYLMVHMYQHSPSGGMPYTVMSLDQQKEVRTYLVDFIEQYSRKLIEQGLKDGLLASVYAYVQAYKDWIIPEHEVSGDVVGQNKERETVARAKREVIRRNKEDRRAIREANVNEWLDKVCNLAMTEIEKVAYIVQALAPFPDLQVQERAKALAIIEAFSEGDARRSHLQGRYDAILSAPVPVVPTVAALEFSRKVVDTL